MSNLRLPNEQGTTSPVGETDHFEARLQVENGVRYKPIKAELQVPSGKLVISGNDFSNRYTSNDQNLQETQCGDPSKLKHQFEAYAKRGLIFGYMGNSIPMIYQEDNSLVLGNNPNEEEQENFVRIPGEEVGSLCTGVSSYFIADYDDYISKGGKAYPTEEDQQLRVVCVKPGRYVVTQCYGLSTFDSDPGAIIFATVERSEDPILNPAYPEEILEATVTKLFPKARYYFINVSKPFEEFKVEIAFDEGAFTSVIIPIDKVSDDTFVKQSIEQAWQESLEERAQINLTESRLPENLYKMEVKDPSLFSQLKRLLALDEGE